MSDFRQGTINRLQVRFLNQTGTPVDQPSGLPTVEIIYVNSKTSQPTTALSRSLMKRLETGTYFFDWGIPLDEPQLVHQIIYRGQIGNNSIIGEDIATVLRATSMCAFVPSTVPTTTTTTTTICGCS